MGVVCSSPDTALKDPSLVIDVEKVLADSTWDMFRISKGKYERRFLKRSDYEIHVPMHYYHFSEVDTKMWGITHRPQGATGLGNESSLLNGGPKEGKSEASQSLLSGKGLAYGDKTSPGQMGLQTEFNNDTDIEQTYTFNFEKVRTASVEVSYQKGFSIGAKANFSIGLPKVLGDGSIGVEVDKRLEITKSTGERFEETLKTSATSDIKVKEKSRYVATIVMEERPLLANFTTVVEMSMPAGSAPIYLKNVKTGQSSYIRTVNNLWRTFRKFKEKGIVSPVLDENNEERADVIRFTIQGIVDGIQLSSHKIHLQQMPLLPRDSLSLPGTTTSSAVTPS